MNTADVFSSAPLFQVSALSFAREEEPVFGPLSFRLEAGQALAIEGGNGAGKTSLIRVIAGLIEPTEGELQWQGAPLSGPRPPGCFALLGHHLGLKIDLSALENLRFRLRVDGTRGGISAATALKSVGLEGYEDMPVRALSAGQRKRVALAALLINPAPVWLLDEPYANLDRDGQLIVDRMLETHCLRGGAVILTSHGLIAPNLSRLATLRLDGTRA